MEARSASRLLALALLASSASASFAFDSVDVETDVYAWSETAEPVAPKAILAQYGPFQVIAPDRAELNGSIESDTPAQFAAMLRAFPAIRNIDMVDCPGTGDDEANLSLARMVRKAGIATYVPNGGSVRSGGVELFLAGVKRRAAPEAEFAVHSWVDEDGMEPGDFAESDPVNREYVAYYREMGMSAEKAKAFYALTNSVPHDDVLYLKPRDIAAYLPLD
ncbi:MAG: hypothetical protein ACK4ZE_02870 [Sphingorhabdus sp.]